MEPRQSQLTQELNIWVGVYEVLQEADKRQSYELNHLMQFGCVAVPIIIAAHPSPLSFCSALVWCVHPVLNRRHTQWGLVPTRRWCPCVQGPHGQCGGWVRGFRVFPHCGRVGLTAVKVFSPAGPGVHHTSLARSGTAFDERHRAVCAALLTAYHHANSRESTPESRAYNNHPRRMTWAGQAYHSGTAM